MRCAALFGDDLLDEPSSAGGGYAGPDVLQPQVGALAADLHVVSQPAAAHLARHRSLGIAELALDVEAAPVAPHDGERLYPAVLAPPRVHLDVAFRPALRTMSRPLFSSRG